MLGFISVWKSIVSFFKYIFTNNNNEEQWKVSMERKLVI